MPKYRDRIRVVRSENQGFGATLSKCIQEASGDYVCLLDADDYFARDKIISILPEIEKGYLYIENCKHHVDKDDKLLNNEIYSGSNTSTLCLKRSEALTLIPVGDNEIFFHPLKLAGHGIVLKKPLTYYRIHNSSMTNYKEPSLQHQYLAKVTHALADKLQFMSQDSYCNWADSELLTKISKEYRSIAYYNEMEAALELSQRQKALVASYHLLISSLGARNGISFWHIKVFLRGVFGKPIYLYGR